MRRALAIVAALALTAMVPGCGDGGGRAENKPLLIHVGGTMKPVMDKVAAQYTARTGRAVEINSAGSGELLAHIAHPAPVLSISNAQHEELLRLFAKRDRTAVAACVREHLLGTERILSGLLP